MPVEIHPDCPARLRRKYAQCKCNMRALAKSRGVNIYYISRAIRFGERPVNKQIAKTLFFPKAKRPTTPKPAQATPRHITWWREIGRERRNAYILAAWTEKHLGEKP